MVIERVIPLATQLINEMFSTKKEKTFEKDQWSVKHYPFFKQK